jgi:hypothetical protein
MTMSNRQCKYTDFELYAILFLVRRGVLKLEYRP